MLDLNTLRRQMAEYMLNHPRASLDSAILYVLKLVYEKGYEDGIEQGFADGKIFWKASGEFLERLNGE